MLYMSVAHQKLGGLVGYSIYPLPPSLLGSLLTKLQGCKYWWGKGDSYPPPQFLAGQLTLFQPGRRLCPPNYYCPPPLQIFRSFYGPELREMQPFLK